MYTYIGGRESIVVMIIIFIVVLIMVNTTSQLWLLGDLGFPLDVTLARFHI